MSCDTCKFRNMDEFEADKFHDECGVIGIYQPGDMTTPHLAYYGLHSLQHRGQESAGIAVNKGGVIKYYKEMGLLSEVFNDDILNSLSGDISIGHVRYSSAAASHVSNSQPLVVNAGGRDIAIAHNGSLSNVMTLRSELSKSGVIFQTETDSEVFLALVAKNLYKGDLAEALISMVSPQVREIELIRAIKAAAQLVKGAFAFVITAEDKLIGVRDPNGVRPLCIGKTKKGYVLSSESCAFPLLEAELVRDVEPGEIVVIQNNEISSFRYSENARKAVCSFEYVYFARTDSYIDGVSVYASRRQAGRTLAKEHPVDADLVIAVPDSGTVAAIGYAEGSGIPFGEGLVKNRYVGRTFIQPTQELRDLGVKMKLSALAENVKGKRIVMVDDSIVRGTTSGKIVKMLRDAGATEVHLMICSPPVTYSCYMGINTPQRKNLIAANMSIEDICKFTGADSLHFISPEGLAESILGANQICTACFDGNYPCELTDIDNEMEGAGRSATMVGEYD